MPNDPLQTHAKLSRLAVSAVVLAFLLAASGFVSAVQNPPLIVPALIALVAGTGILRKQVWSAYGYALFQLAGLMSIPLILFRSGHIATSQLAVFSAANLLLAAFFWLVGRSLVRARAERGWRLPWIAVAGLMVLMLVFVQTFVMPSGSMEDTLLIGDRLAVRVFPPLRASFGDLVVFCYPADRRQTFVKRVIGLPGDRIRIVSRLVVRNGYTLREPYAVTRFPPDDRRDNLPGNIAGLPMGAGLAAAEGVRQMLEHVSNGELVIPPKKYFVLGDNRDNSLDSRFWGWLDESDIIGKPLLIYSSSEPLTASIGTANNSALQRIRWGRFFKLL